MTKEQKIRKVIRKVRYFIEKLRGASERPGRTTEVLAATPIVMFLDASRGGMRLTGQEAVRYRECLDELLELHGSQSERRAISPEAIEKLFQTAILRSIRPSRERVEEPRSRVLRRIGRELRPLREGLRNVSQKWLVSLVVNGFAESSLPFTFGGVKFVVATAGAREQLGQSIPAFTPNPRRVSASRIEAEQQTRVRARAELSEAFTGDAIATMTVSAGDHAAARRIAIERLRRTVDVLNYFIDFLERGPKRRAFVPPQSAFVSSPYLVRRESGDAAQWSSGRLDAAPIRSLDLQSDRARKIGLVRAGELLAREERSDLDLRVLNALSWAGRANNEYRRDQAFLLLAIALEALLTKPKSRSGVTDRLRWRAARLIGLKPDTRKEVFELMGELYEMRSALVHTGDATDLTDAALGEMRELVDRALTGVLTDRRFTNMTSAAQFEQWLDEQLFV